jgi:hypothetical protein
VAAKLGTQTFITQRLRHLDELGVKLRLAQALARVNICRVSTETDTHDTRNLRQTARRRSSRARRAALTVLLFTGACSQQHSSLQLKVEIDATADLRDAITEVSAGVEKRDSEDPQWVLITQRRFELSTAADWPLTFVLVLNAAPAGTYQLTAVARDARGAVLAQARALELFGDDTEAATLHAQFDASESLFDAGTDSASDATAGDEALAPECIGRVVNTAFCDEETMRVCPDLSHSEIRPCAEHERCYAINGGAHCACRVGFVETTTGCRAPTE